MGKAKRNKDSANDKPMKSMRHTGLRKYYVKEYTESESGKTYWKIGVASWVK
jgi:hypothetical protein